MTDAWDGPLPPLAARAAAFAAGFGGRVLLLGLRIEVAAPALEHARVVGELRGRLAGPAGAERIGVRTLPHALVHHDRLEPAAEVLDRARAVAQQVCVRPQLLGVCTHEGVHVRP